MAARDHRATRTAPVGTEDGAASDERGAPGLVLVFSSRPLAIPFPAKATLGRDALLDMGVEDAEISRQHCVVTASKAAEPSLTLTDLGSRNGTFVDGKRIEESVALPFGAIVRAGGSLFVATEDTSSFERCPTAIGLDGVVRGPTTAEIEGRAEAMGALGQLLVCGESGVGKEHVARAFHGAASSRTPFVALNCATLPAGLAERLLFGAKKGVYTGAGEDAEGYIQSAEGGTLFLDEVGELDLGVQAKLLRFLESREYFPLGELRARTAKVRVCLATLRDLSHEVAARRFREDLYHRISTPVVRMPPLRERRSEIPFLIELAGRRFEGRIRPTLAFVERALVARWPGNVRQLLRTVEVACVAADAARRDSLRAADLELDERPSSEPEPSSDALTADPTDDEVRLALTVSGGNISIAARALGMHRSKLRRRLQKLEIESN